MVDGSSGPEPPPFVMAHVVVASLVELVEAHMRLAPESSKSVTLRSGRTRQNFVVIAVAQVDVAHNNSNQRDGDGRERSGIS